MDVTFLVVSSSAAILSNYFAQFDYEHAILQGVAGLLSKWENGELTEEVRFEVAKFVVGVRSGSARQILISNSLGTMLSAGLCWKLLKQKVSTSCLLYGGAFTSALFLHQTAKSLVRYIKLLYNRKQIVLDLVADADPLIKYYNPSLLLQYRMPVAPRVDLVRFSRDYKFHGNRHHSELESFNVSQGADLVPSPTSQRLELDQPSNKSGDLDAGRSTLQSTIAIDSTITESSDPDQETNYLEALYLSGDVRNDKAQSIQSFLKKGLSPSEVTEDCRAQIVMYQRRGSHHYHLVVNCKYLVLMKLRGVFSNDKA